MSYLATINNFQVVRLQHRFRYRIAGYRTHLQVPFPPSSSIPTFKFHSYLQVSDLPTFGRPAPPCLPACLTPQYHGMEG
jgi:hypothetical protein